MTEAVRRVFNDRHLGSSLYVMRKTIAALALISVANTASACSCRVYTASELFADARAIFVARVMEISLHPHPAPPAGFEAEYERLRVSVRAAELVKAESVSRMDISWHRNCGPHLKVGWDYLFLIRSNNSADACSIWPAERFPGPPANEMLKQFRALKDRK